MHTQDKPACLWCSSVLLKVSVCRDLREYATTFTRSILFILSLSLMIIHPVGSPTGGRVVLCGFTFSCQNGGFTTLQSSTAAIVIVGVVYGLFTALRHVLSCGPTSVSPKLAAPSCACRHLHSPSLTSRFKCHRHKKRQSQNSKTT